MTLELLYGSSRDGASLLPTSTWSTNPAPPRTLSLPSTHGPVSAPAATPLRLGSALPPSATARSLEPSFLAPAYLASLSSFRSFGLTHAFPPQLYSLMTLIL